MKTKSIFLNTAIFALMHLCSGPGIFALEVGEQEVEITLTQSYASRFISEGQDGFPDDGPIWETTLDIAFPQVLYGSDLCFSAWWGYPLKSGNVAAEEVDYSVAIAREIKEILNISGGYNYFDFPRANNNSDLNEFWGLLQLERLPFLPIPVSAALYAEYEFKATREGPENGWYYFWGLGTKLLLPRCKIFQEAQNLSLDVTNWGTDGVGGLKPSSLYATECSVATSYSFAGFSITPSFNYLFSYEDTINDEDEAWVRIEVSYSF